MNFLENNSPMTQTTRGNTDFLSFFLFLLQQINKDVAKFIFLQFSTSVRNQIKTLNTMIILIDNIEIMMPIEF